MPNANPKRNPFQALVEDTLKRLSAQIAKLEMSQEDAASKIRKALEKKYADPMADEYANWRNVPYVVATYSDRIIVSKDEKCFALPYTFNADGDCELGEPVEVEITWTPKTNAEPNATATMASAPSSAPNPVALSATPYQGGDNPMSQPNPIPATPPPATNPEASASVAPTIPATNPLPVTPIDPALSVEEQIRLAREQATQAALEQQKAFEAQLAAARKEAWERAQAEMTRKQNVAALSQKLTSGRFQLPFTPEELDEVLLKLSDADRAIIAPVLEKIHDKGLVELGERGTAAHGRGVKELPAYAKSHLQTFLASKGTLQEFFAANIELGKPEDYDLYEFEKK